MNYYNDVNNIEYNPDTVITIGTFDGVHLGHQKIIAKLLDESKKENLRNIVITFYPHPRKVLSIDYNLKILTDKTEKLEMLKFLGVQNLLNINFTKEFSQLEYENFVKDYLIAKIGIKKLVVGYDHRLGKNASGKIDNLKKIAEKYNFEVIVVDPLIIENEIISSTKIRKHLLNSELDIANKSLGRNYSIRGRVIHGLQRGRNIGFPTANVATIDPDKLVPSNGVYFVQIDIEDTPYWGVMNIGLRPTFKDLTEPLIEVHIFDFDDDIYDYDVNIHLITKVRDEKKFNSVDDLIKQIKDDINFCIEYKKSLNLNSIL
ncbi:MAG TPA: bifunctional riboflavin kinase/FAD synthetase [Ignavibacteriales bacterium]|nr:bifunctional riboflavin kinase/FAD synthetase [Ignavibacteriales bacterium]HPD66815.1 bifunctional riboflavin kinase/FAD synthetase [Ignavibacteriales bacterium]HRR18198.1 bifunctional riboflavin kinase/FAD synthetase [Ignavibacteriales bacterium]